MELDPQHIAKIDLCCIIDNELLCMCMCVCVEKLLGTMAHMERERREVAEGKARAHTSLYSSEELWKPVEAGPPNGICRTRRKKRCYQKHTHTQNSGGSALPRSGSPEHHQE